MSQSHTLLRMPSASCGALLRTTTLTALTTFACLASMGPAIVYADKASPYNATGPEIESARKRLHEHAGGQINSLLMAERLEYQSADGNPNLLWDAQGWLGGDLQKFWFKTEGAYNAHSSNVPDAEIQGLYSRAISAFFDAQVGYRADLAPNPERHYLVAGVQGLARYWFELDAATFISHKGGVSARLKAEYDVLLTQRLILQPRLELNLSAHTVPERGIGRGLTSSELGLRLRYEVQREIAPYVGLSWSALSGESANLARDEGEPPRELSIVAGIRLWF